MKLKTKFITTLGLFSIIATQSGCITGFIAPPVTWPLIVAGTGMTIIGGVGIHHSIHHNSASYRDPRDYYHTDRLWGTLIGSGLILGENNPGRNEALNELPIDKKIARRFGVSIQDLSTYNDNLLEIQHTHKQLRQDIHDGLTYVHNSLLSGNNINLSLDDKLQKLAKRYGFEDSESMIRTFQQSKLTQAQLQKFAHSEGIRLEKSHAQIMLQADSQLNIQIEKE